MTEAASRIEPGLDPGLTETLTAVIMAADGPPERALVVDHVVEEIVSIVASDPSLGDDEQDSLLPVLDADDEHSERMGALRHDLIRFDRGSGQSTTHAETVGLRNNWLNFSGRRSSFR